MKKHKNTHGLLCTVLAVCTALTSSLPISAAQVETASGRGDDMCIAILDNGFYLDHESFTLTDTTPKLTKEASDLLIKETSLGKGDNPPETLYVSSKIPFAYDYGDGDSDVFGENISAHGTAMISIAAGNKANAKTENPSAEGTAPEAQILAMKVYSEKANKVMLSAMVNAVNDAVILGADAILITFTSLCGIEDDPLYAPLTAAIEKAVGAGVQVICPVGNVLEYGSESLFDAEYDSDPLPTSSVDIGTVAWPASIPSVISVASAIDNRKTAYVFDLAADTEVPYSDSNYLYPDITGGKLFSTFFEGQALEYVMVSGIGEAEDFAAAGDLKGKLAVIDRGTLSFSQKAKNAAAAGAIGVIVIDNQPHAQVTFDTYPDLTGAEIPLILIPMNYGNELELEPDKTIRVSREKTYTVTTRDTPYPSPFSAAGTTPELTLKPDITAIGSDVGCASVSGGYAKISSTAAAAARIAGEYVIIKGTLAANTSSENPTEIAETAKALLLNSAEVMTLPATAEPYSPRRQGAGVSMPDAALSSGIIMHSNGKYKIELGELDFGFATFDVTVKNISEQKKSCTLDAIIGSDGFTTFTVADIDAEPKEIPLDKRLGLSSDHELSFITGFKEFSLTRVYIGDGYYELNRSAEDYSPYSFELEPGKSVTLKMSVFISPEEYKLYKEHFKYGFFIEGFLQLSAEDNVSSLPIAGFVGNFAEAPALDAEIYDGISPLFENVYLYRDTGSDTRQILGEKTSMEYYDTPIYEEDKLFFSPGYDKNLSTVMLNLGLLRTVTDVSVTVSDKDGNIINSTVHGTLARTYTSSLTGMLESPKLPLWNGRAADNFAYIYPDGTYTVTVSFRKPSSKAAETLTYKLHLDKTAPVIEKSEFNVSEYKCTLELKINDSFGVRHIRVSDSKKKDATQTADGLWNTTMLTGQYIYVDAFDYANNRTTIRLENPVYNPG